MRWAWVASMQSATLLDWAALLAQYCSRSMQMEVSLHASTCIPGTNESRLESRSNHQVCRQKATCRACPSPKIPTVTTSSAAMADIAVTGSATHDSNSSACKACAVSAQLPVWVQSPLVRPVKAWKQAAIRHSASASDGQLGSAPHQRCPALRSWAVAVGREQEADVPSCSWSPFG